MQHIKALSRFRIAAWFALAFAAFLAPAQAQVEFGAGVSTAAVMTNTPFIYTIGVTNEVAASSQIVRITSTASSRLEVIAITNRFNQTVTVTNESDVLVFRFPNLAFGVPAVLDLVVISTNAVSVTNRFDVFLGNSTNVFTNITLVTLVTNAAVIQSDLFVNIQVPTVPVLVNDNFSYSVSVTNNGAFPASNVVLSNLLPTGMVFRNVSSSNRADINIGTLAANSGRRYTILARATNSGSLNVTASVTASGITDTNGANNVASANFLIEPILLNQLIATNLTAPRLNHQNALVEQQIRLVNVSTSAVASARVLVTGLNYWLRNAVGTNNGTPFVAYSAPLAVGESVDLLMQYFVPSRNPDDLVVGNPSYIAVPTSAFSVTAPTNYTLAITTMTNLPGKGFLIEFPATPGRTYTILYSDTVAFSNTFAAIPSIVAQANRVQWIDSGPPKTTSLETNSNSRFYRVLENP